MAVTAITIRVLGTDVAVESVKQLKAEIKAAKKEMEATSDANHYAKKSQEVAQMTAEVKRLEAEQRRMNQAAIAAGSAAGSYTQMNAKLNELKQTYKSMSQAERDSPIGKATLAELQKLDKKLKEVDATMGNYQRNVGNYPRGIQAFAGGVSQSIGIPDPSLLMAGGGAAAAGAVAAAAFVKATQMSVAYKEALTDVQVITGKTEAETDALVKSLSDINANGVQITTTYTDTAKTLQSTLNVLGDLANGNDELVKRYQEAAVILSKTDPELPLSKSVPVLNQIMKSFNIDFMRVGDVADAVAVSARLADIPVNKVAEGLVNIGDASRLAGVSMEETVAILQVTASGLGGAEEAGTKMRRVMTAMSDTKFLSKPALAALKEANVDMNVMFNTALPLNVRLQELTKIQDNAGALGLVFAESNVSAAAALIRSGAAAEGTTSKIMEMTAAIKEGEENNAAYEMAAIKMAGSTSEKWNTLTAKVANFFTSPVIANGINKILDGLTWIATKATDLANNPFFSETMWNTAFGPIGGAIAEIVLGYNEVGEAANKATSAQDKATQEAVNIWRNASGEMQEELERRYLAQGEHGANMLKIVKAGAVEMEAVEKEAANKLLRIQAEKFAQLSKSEIEYYSNQARTIGKMSGIDSETIEKGIKEKIASLKTTYKQIQAENTKDIKAGAPKLPEEKEKKDKKKKEEEILPTDSIAFLKKKIQELNTEIEKAPSGKGYDDLLLKLKQAAEKLEAAEAKLAAAKRENTGEIAPLDTEIVELQPLAQKSIQPELVAIDTVTQATKDAADERAAYQDKKDRERLETRKALEQAAFDLIKQGADLIFNVQAQNNQRIADREMSDLQRRKQAELDLAGNNEAQKNFINERYAQKEEELRKKQFERDKKMKIEQAITNGALAVTSILAQYPKFDFGVAAAVAIGLAIGTTAFQVATISASKYASGGRVAPYSNLNGKVQVPANWVTDSDGDNTLAYLKTNETVLNEKQSAMIGHGALAAAGVPGYTVQKPTIKPPVVLPKLANEYAKLQETYQHTAVAFQHTTAAVMDAIGAINGRIDRLQVIINPFDTQRTLDSRSENIKRVTF